MIRRIFVLLFYYIFSKGKIILMSIGRNSKIGSNTYIQIGCGIGSNVNIGKNCFLRKNVLIGNNSSIGSYSSVNRNTIIDYAKIDSFCSIGQNCNIGPGTHPTNYISTSQNLYGKTNILGIPNVFNPYSNKTLIEEDVWIGANCTIMQGVRISRGSIIGSNSVVTRDTEPYSINAGVPSKKIKMRFRQEKIDYLMSFKSLLDIDKKTLKKYLKLGAEWEN